MNKDSESIGDIVDEIETLCNLARVRFNIYDLKGSLKRVIDSISKRRQ